MSLILDELFEIHGFNPNDGQREAITSLNGPLFLMAGPGSGKTRVLLWRVVNMLVFHDVQPEKIFLSTFTEKAAKQLQDGLQSILGTVTNKTGKPYDLSKMYVGTIHSLCQRIISDRRFIPDRSRVKIPVLLDELEQYFLINSTTFWGKVQELLHIEEEDFRSELKIYFEARSSSKHNSAQSLINIFNRFSEENLTAEDIKTRAKSINDEVLEKIAVLYGWYTDHLFGRNQVDFSLLQQKALQTLLLSEHVTELFEHIIIDEYQDTNKIQEKLIFRLAKGYKNLCVVGDDDQALYRFRGATVENFVQFPQRCNKYLGVSPKEIKLNINYRSKKQIVKTYTSFIDQIDWEQEDGTGYYRLHNKNIQPFNQEEDIAVVTSTPGTYDDVAKEIAEFTKSLVDEKKVADPNQIAFLFPALKNNSKARAMKHALEKVGLKVYAPRAGRFLDVEEAKALFGLYLHILGKPNREEYGGAYSDYHDWMENSMSFAKELMEHDERLARFVELKKEELSECRNDYIRLLDTVDKKGWTLKDSYDPKVHKRDLLNTSGISLKARKGLGTTVLDKIAEEKSKEGKPFSLQYILNRATSLDWSILDLFYRICGFAYFSQMFKLAEDGTDEGPICNLSMLSDYLARFLEQGGSIITGAVLIEGGLVANFFGRYVYGLYQLGESEYEDDETPFPKGRIPFLTIHQSKGLEFPYVIVGSLEKRNNVPKNEEIIRKVITDDAEPLHRVPEFDAMRLFYVALSRAEKMLILASPRGRGIKTHIAFKQLIEEKQYKTIPNLRVAELPTVSIKHEDIPKVYSYTGDYLLYLKCPRNYMAFKKYGFVPSRSQTMLFGNLVHKTIEDLHNKIISLRG
ncbi:ATP-dependent helicase [Brevibacillus borstelensis]|uniref:ATP-dependent helicase n=1 Tax=Brevibacillus borstelensis TaxID=45462 RepID=UPI002040091F|nr:ATP-dependent helicase [Brevibacillus borstelensis]MCM3591247.1 ATP-dependent helicase [Brevibacillus borstelensis]